MIDLKITFVIPFITLTGGIKAPMEYGNRLHDMGHDVVFVYPQNSPYLCENTKPKRTLLHILEWLRGEIRYWGAKLLRRSELEWFTLKPSLIRVHDLSERHVPDGDVIVAVDWPTAEKINSYSASKGKKFHLIQGYEIWSGSQERVDATWRMPLHKIVISSWLKDIAEQRFGQKVHGPLIHGVDLKQFYSDSKVYHQPRRVGMLYHDLEIKGLSDGIEAFEIVKQTFPDIQLVMFGRSKPGSRVPDYVEFYRDPTQTKLREIYCSCDIWLCPSRMDGGPMHPQEAMACKCALVTTNVGAIADYTVPGETALVSPPGEPHALAQNLIRLLEDEEELRRVSLAGYQKIREFTWEKAAKQLELFFLTA